VRALDETSRLNGRVRLPSADRGVKMGGIECKRLPASQETFRSLIVTPPR
jgi:hypothetical protein